MTAYNHGRGEWPMMSAAERIAAVEKFTRLVVARKQEIVQLLLWEIGKSAADSNKEFDRTIDYIRNTIDALKDMDRDSSRFTIEEGIIGQIRRSPLGVVLCMGPFNYPLNETFCMRIPALLYPVKEGMKVWREEQFGPVVPVARFAQVEEAIQYLIDSDYGQQVSIFGSESQEVADLIDQLANQVSCVNLNAQCQRGPDTFPFTGRKDSAEGTLSVFDALRSFSIRTVVATKMTEANKHLLNTIVAGQESSFLSTRFIL